MVLTQETDESTKHIKAIFETYKNELSALKAKIKECLGTEHKEEINNMLYKIDIRSSYLPFPSISSYDVKYGNEWGILALSKTEIEKEKRLSEIRGIQQPENNITIDICSLLDYLANKLDKSAKISLKFSTFILLLFSLLSEFVIITVNMLKITETMSKERTTKARDNTLKMVNELRKVCNYSYLKIMALFKLNKRLLQECISTIGIKDSDQITNGIINSCLNTLNSLSHLDKMPEGILQTKSTYFNYLLKFEINNCLFSPRFILKFIEMVSNYTTYEKIIKNLHILNDMFYREHMLHTLHVLSLANKCKENIEKKLYQVETGETQDHKELDKITLRHSLFLSIIFHDIGYPIEKISDIIPRFITPLEKFYPIEFGLATATRNLTSKGVIMKEKSELFFIKQMFKILKSDGDDLNRNVFERIKEELTALLCKKEVDHGYISAVILYERFSEYINALKRYLIVIANAKKDKTWAVLNRNKELLDKLLNRLYFKKIFEYSILAVAFHNIKIKDKNTSFRIKKCKNSDKSEILAFISTIKLLDLLQEWGRSPTKYDTVILKNLELEDNKLIIELKYVYAGDTPNEDYNSLEAHIEKVLRECKRLELFVNEIHLKAQFDLTEESGTDESRTIEKSCSQTTNSTNVAVKEISMKKSL